MWSVFFSVLLFTLLCLLFCMVQAKKAITQRQCNKHISANCKLVSICDENLKKYCYILPFATAFFPLLLFGAHFCCWHYFHSRCKQKTIDSTSKSKQSGFYNLQSSDVFLIMAHFFFSSSSSVDFYRGTSSLRMEKHSVALMNRCRYSYEN